MKHLNTLFVCLLFSSSTLLAQDQLVKRRVLLVDFANLQNKADFEYLQISIPEAMLTALSDTKNFDLLPADTWSNLVDRGDFAAKDNRSDQKARNAGLSRGADVVVLGSFVNINQDLKITARAIETESGRVIVSKSVLAKTDGSMFGSIDKLSVDMAKEMKTKLPPLPPREIIREKQGPSRPLQKQTLARISYGKPLLTDLSTVDWRMSGDLILFAGPFYSRFFGKLTYGKMQSSTSSGTLISAGLGLIWPLQLTKNFYFTPGLGFNMTAVNGNYLMLVSNTALPGSLPTLENLNIRSESYGPVGTISFEYAFSSAPVGIYVELMTAIEATESTPQRNVGELTGLFGVTYRGYSY